MTNKEIRKMIKSKNPMDLRNGFIGLVTDIHEVIDRIEEEALALGSDELSEIVLAFNAVVQELEKIYKASRDLGFKGDKD